MGKRSKRSILNEESYIQEKKPKVNKHVTVESHPNDDGEPANENKLKGIKADNKLVAGNSKKAIFNKMKINKQGALELNLDDAKEPANRKKVKEIEVSNLLTVTKIKNVAKEKKGKNKTHEQVEIIHDNKVPTKEKKHNKSEAANKSVLTDSDGGKAKIIFVDSEPHQVPASSGSTNKRFLNEDEAEVKDEDIDKFCDELDEKDNAQYEDWVKLIEAKLHSNKKKPV